MEETAKASNRCSVCGTESEKELPGFRLDKLEGAPIICQHCFGGFFGAMNPWLEDVEKDFKKREI